MRVVTGECMRVAGRYARWHGLLVSSMLDGSSESTELEVLAEGGDIGMQVGKMHGNALPTILEAKERPVWTGDGDGPICQHMHPSISSPSEMTLSHVQGCTTDSGPRDACRHNACIIS
jgi:hypothetical protein